MESEKTIELDINRKMLSIPITSSWTSINENGENFPHELTVSSILSKEHFKRGNVEEGRFRSLLLRLNLHHPFSQACQLRKIAKLSNEEASRDRVFKSLQDGQIW